MDPRDVRDLVAAHFHREDLTASVLQALRTAGTDVDRLGAVDLSPVDHLHAGGADTTKRVLGLAGVGSATRLLDVGCGVGGTARMAALTGADVDGVDLTHSMVGTAQDLTALVGLTDRVRLHQSSMESMPFEDQVFDAATMLHVAMNVPDKAAAFTEVRRVLRPHAPFVAYEQMRTGRGRVPYPLPWAIDEQTSFVETPEQYAEHLESAGFAVISVEDHTPAQPHMPPGLGPGVVLGPDFDARVENNIRSTHLGVLGSVLIVATA